jgi:hypothetical protein
MNTSTKIQLAPVQDLRAAREDREAYHKAGSRGNQLAFAFVDAAVANPFHHAAYQVAAVAKRMK